MSKIAIVDEKDNIVGYKERLNRNPKDIYRVSCLWITNSQNEILLAQRKLTKKHNPGCWGPAVAGTVEEGESYEENIYKEAKEELGIDKMKFTPDLKFRSKSFYPFFCQVYKVKLDRKINEFQIAQDEVEQIQWFSRDFLLQDCLDHPEKYTPSTPDLIKLLK